MEKFYFCVQCKQILHEIDECMFIEDNARNSFCSEDCILEYYHNVIEYFENSEKNERFKIGVHDKIESIYGKEKIKEFYEQTIKEPQKIKMLCNEIKQKYFFLINECGPKKECEEFESEGKTVYLCVVVKSCEERVSIVLHHFFTHSLALIDNYTRNAVRVKSLKDENPILRVNEVRNKLKSRNKEDISLSDFNESEEKLTDGNDPAVSKVDLVLEKNIVELIDKKKSFLWMKLKEIRTHRDIPVDRFTVFDDHLGQTLSLPDEIYEYRDEGKNLFLTYVKCLEYEQMPIYYIVVCLHYQTDSNAGLETVIPIISFPSNDFKVYRNFIKGEKVAGNHLN